MDYTFTSLPKLFVDEMIKLDEIIYQSCVWVIKNRKVEKIKSTDGKNVFCKRKRGKYFESC